MDLSNLKPAKGSNRKGKRVGRGQGSGKGGTSTRGSKGAGSRSGKKLKIGFEGGQMPLQRRVPKYGFKNINRIEYVPINLNTLQKIFEVKGIDKFDQEVYQKYGLVAKNRLVKILGRGELKAKLEIHAHSFSASALQAIEKNGGKAIKL